MQQHNHISISHLFCLIGTGIKIVKVMVSDMYLKSKHILDCSLDFDFTQARIMYGLILQ